MSLWCAFAIVNSRVVQFYSVVFFYSEDLGKDVEFEVVGDAPEKVGPKQAEDAAKSITNGSDDGAQPSTSTGESWPQSASALLIIH